MNSLRLFFALWPDTAMQAALATAAARVIPKASAAGRGPRAVPAENLHLTLTFLGSVQSSRVEVAGQVAAKCAEALGRNAAPIEFVFESVEHWRKPEILCAVAREASLVAVRLAQTLTGALTAQGFTPDLTKPFRPHVTLARNVSHPSRDTSFPPVTWAFSQFALVQSRTAPGGSIYTVLASYRFSQDDQRE